MSNKPTAIAQRREAKTAARAAKKIVAKGRAAERAKILATVPPKLGPGNGAATQAKIITPAQLSDLLRKIATSSTSPLRDKVGIYLSYYCGLRAQEIAGLMWQSHVLDAQGNIGEKLYIGGDVSKGGRARVLPLPPKVREALSELRATRPMDKYVFHRLDLHTGAEALTPNAVAQWFRRTYAEHDLTGCSSHSGRRTAITLFARKVGDGQTSIRDVQEFAGHSDIKTTMTYIEPSGNVEALVAGLYN